MIIICELLYFYIQVNDVIVVKMWITCRKLRICQKEQYWDM